MTSPPWFRAPPRWTLLLIAPLVVFIPVLSTAGIILYVAWRLIDFAEIRHVGAPGRFSPHRMLLEILCPLSDLGVPRAPPARFAMASRRIFAMAAPNSLRIDFDAKTLRREARGSRTAVKARRLLTLTAIWQGGQRGEAARTDGVTFQIVRDWVRRFNADGPAGLLARNAPCAAPKLDVAQRRARGTVGGRGPSRSCAPCPNPTRRIQNIRVTDNS